MNTGFLRHAVATVLTVYGIETKTVVDTTFSALNMLQQCLPFTVLKPSSMVSTVPSKHSGVATVLTVYGIETQ